MRNKQLMSGPIKTPAVRPAVDFLDDIQSRHLWHPGQRLKLHLGCGEQHFDGYVNIDQPPSEHSVQTRVAADIFADITRLSLPPQSVDEIRLHHVLEHFDRATALALLCRWHQWLKPGGLLVLETPDLNASLPLLLSGQYSYPQKQSVLRHLFGSHEARWAVHCDGWYEEKYRCILDALGFAGLEFSAGQWQMTRNITVRACKSGELSSNELRQAAAELLRDSLVDESEGEQKLLQTWLTIFDALPLLPDVIRADDREGRVPVVPRPCPAAAPSVSGSRESLSILHTVEFYPPHTGGAEFVVQQISERLVRRGHRVTVATSHLDERGFRELNGVAVVGFAVRGNLAEGITGESVRYQHFLLEHDADVMMNYAAQQWATDLAFDRVAETRGRRVNIFAPCGYSALADHRTLRWPVFRDYFERRLPEVLPLYDAVVYHSGIYQDFEFGRALKLENGVIIPNGTHEEEFTRPLAVNFRERFHIATRFFGLCVANFHADKGQDCVIECVRQMKRPDFTMVFIGREGGECAALRQQASGLEIRFLVDISREDTVAAFRSADLFLLASRIEASHLVIIEAKAAALPFVSTDCGNVREWQGGIVCAPEKMAVEALRLLDDDGVRRRLGQEGQREWQEELTWDAVTDRWEELYLRLHRERGFNANAHGGMPGNNPVEHPRIFGQMQAPPMQSDSTKQLSRLVKEHAQLLEKCRLLERQVESAKQWQSRNWLKRAFHKWRPAMALPGKVERREAGSQRDGNQA